MNKRPPWLIYFGPSQQNTKPHGSSPAGAVGQPKGASVTRPYVPGVGYVSPRNMGGPRHNLGYRYGAGLRNYISPIKGLGIGDFLTAMALGLTLLLVGTAFILEQIYPLLLEPLLLLPRVVLF